MRPTRASPVIDVLLSVLLIAATAGPAAAAGPTLPAEAPRPSVDLEHPPVSAADIACATPAPLSTGVGTGYFVAVLAWLEGDSLVPLEPTGPC